MVIFVLQKWKQNLIITESLNKTTLWGKHLTESLIGSIQLALWKVKYENATLCTPETNNSIVNQYTPIQV